jgi:hypothetical protein
MQELQIPYGEERNEPTCQQSPWKMGIQYDDVDLVTASPPPPPSSSITPSLSPSAQHIETAPNFMEYNVKYVHHW